VTASGRVSLIGLQLPSLAPNPAQTSAPQSQISRTAARTGLEGSGAVRPCGRLATPGFVQRRLVPRGASDTQRGAKEDFQLHLSGATSRAALDWDRDTTGSQTGQVTVRLITLSLRQVLRLLLLTCRSSRSKDLELLVLRQELAVLRRQVPHPKTTREERLVLTVIQRLRPLRERLSNLFTPDTLRRWHRELVRSKWERPYRINKRKTIPLQTQLLVWRMSRENPMWGYRRIQGELHKIGIDISATSIRRIMAPKRRPGPKRDTWRKFMVSQGLDHRL